MKPIMWYRQSVAIAVHAMGLTKQNKIIIQTRGGELVISFQVSETDIRIFFSKGLLDLCLKEKLMNINKIHLER